MLMGRPPGLVFAIHCDSQDPEEVVPKFRGQLLIDVPGVYLRSNSIIFSDLGALFRTLSINGFEAWSGIDWTWLFNITRPLVVIEVVRVSSVSLPSLLVAHRQARLVFQPLLVHPRFLCLLLAL
jgi:hypothetical protein